MAWTPQLTWLAWKESHSVLGLTSTAGALCWLVDMAAFLLIGQQ